MKTTTTSEMVNAISVLADDFDVKAEILRARKWFIDLKKINKIHENISEANKLLTEVLDL